MMDQELPFDAGEDQNLDVPGALITMDMSGPGFETDPSWEIALHWRFPSAEHVVASGVGDTYEEALENAKRMLYVKYLSRRARDSLR